MKKYRRIILVWISICCGIILASCGEKETDGQEEDTRITEDKTELNEEKFYEMTETLGLDKGEAEKYYERLCEDNVFQNGT